MGQSDQLGHDCRQGVVALTCIGEEVARPAAGVGEYMVQGYTCGDLIVGEAQVREIGAQGSVEVEHTALDQAQGHRAGDSLGDRANLKECIRSHL